MLRILKPAPGDRPSAQTISLIIDAINQQNLTVGPGLNMTRNANGTTISLVPTKPVVGGASAATAVVSASGVELEMAEAWNSANTYNVIGDRVVYKPAGATYSYVYATNASGVLGTDIPGTSSKWTKITDTIETAWASGSTYTNGQKVSYQISPWQIYNYTASGSIAAGQVPGTASGWVGASGVVLGIATYPVLDPADGVTKCYPPFFKKEVYRTTYSLSTHELVNYIREEHFDKNGSITEIKNYTKRVTETSVAHT